MEMITVEAIDYLLEIGEKKLGGTPVGTFMFRVRFDGIPEIVGRTPNHVSIMEWKHQTPSGKVNIARSVWGKAEGEVRNQLNHYGVNCNIGWYGNIFTETIPRFMDELVKKHDHRMLTGGKP